jgi:hypothetical protein
MPLFSNFLVDVGVEVLVVVVVLVVLEAAVAAWSVPYGQSRLIFYHRNFIGPCGEAHPSGFKIAVHVLLIC